MGTQKILLPISGKYHGERAQKALDLAMKFISGEVILLHAYEPLPALVGGGAHKELVNEANKEALEILTPFRDWIAKAGFTCRTIAEEGMPAESIVRVAHEEKVDLIVMFTDGRDELSDWFLGSVSERVLRASDIPMLILRR